MTKQEILDFINSFDSIDACAEECMKREEELCEQITAYTKLISNAFDDPRLEPVVYLRKIGASVIVNRGKDQKNVLEMFAGFKENIPCMIQSLSEEADRRK